ncbi:MFS transporter [Paraburkholderia phenoliruptrix]|uniref:Major facilitator superfamily protein n=2 Tax=Paraburkholderia phenoliruptrix TaxID=252970 RepID=K0E172_9BURK|nr:MFS transporter [Paraburkholderia phenoliruptrix]AFT89429.1 major facilitator superfamily protein [Paraburkholderia phenoliruptrix BR3459a]MDR6421914.1 MHS family proline/betaine transporter-like MFS transporter [Paraburkholderia phenoliruptrix]CAB4050628.1 Proline/betaine transporter [Paraburkholderia phenoliruptrix]
MNSTVIEDRVQPKSTTPMRRLIVATSIGNALEWFDFAAYGFFAVTLSKLFFPAHDETVSLLLTFGTFGLSYVFRPLGALLLGRYADRHGRKAALLAALALTTIGTLICAVIPTYASIGIAAPIGLMTARILIAFSTGGEFGSGTALMIEQKSRRKSFLGSWQFSSQGMSTVLASCAGLALSTQLSPAQIESWGWRAPFIFGLLVAPVGLYIRKHIDDTLPAAGHAATHNAPVRELLAHSKARILIAAGIMAVSTAASYLMILYMPTYAVKQLHLPASTGFAATVVTGTILMVFTPLMGHLSDRYGRSRMMVISAIATLATIYPCFVWLVKSPSFTVLISIMALAGMLKAIYFGPLAAVLSSLFPTHVRSTGLGFSYNLGVMVFGGFTPWLVTAMIGATHDPLSPAFYLMACAVLSLACVGLYHFRLVKHI